jgi:hypothetical protein
LFKSTRGSRRPDRAKFKPGRRSFVKCVVAGGGAGAMAGLAAPYVGDAAAAAGKTLKIQSLWTENTFGYQTFKNWCEGVK